MKIPILWWIAPLSSIISIAFAYYFHKQVSKKNPGNDRMQEIAGYVREGSFAYLKQQYKGVAIFFLLAFLLFNFMAWGLKLLDPLIPFAFLTGGFFSGLAGFIGMNTATMASSRTSQGCTKSLNEGLNIAFKAGAVMGLIVVGLALIDISAWFFVLIKLNYHLEKIVVIMLSFGMGAST
ncbi:MAG: sodium/proton-translocating pyrophosphatase, partial [Candidatus Cloacimonetes bacterium]|nr:sodium/proton-translocating pyrophosphatase [Candidatus Cloacimonadota bacterium]